MARDCARCGATIEADDVSYAKHDGEDATATYCSVNCIADVDHVDEAAARSRLFEDGIEA